MLKSLPAVKSYLQSVGQGECLSLIWKYTENENGEKDCSQTKILKTIPLKVFDDYRRGHKGPKIRWTDCTWVVQCYV